MIVQNTLLPAVCQFICHHHIKPLFVCDGINAVLSFSCWCGQTVLQMVKFNMYLCVFLTVWSVFEVLYINIFMKEQEILCLSYSPYYFYSN